MYSNERGSGINLKDIVAKLVFLALFVLLLLWLFPKVPNMIPFYSNVFRENISYMQNAAKSHFTTDKLPKNIGETIEFKLQDMIEQNLILPFVDEDGNSCNVYRSYVSMTKNENDYTLKINLSCNNKEDFIVETLGCYDYCENDVCTKEEKVIEYQFKKGSKKTVESCTCPTGFMPSGNKCAKVISDKIGAEPVFSSNSQEVYNALVEEGETKEIEVSKIVIPGKKVYSCPDGGNVVGESCVKPAKETIKVTTTCKTEKTTGTISSSSCTLIGGGWGPNVCGTPGCPTDIWYNYYKCCSKSSKVIYSCPDGGDLVGKDCIKSAKVTITETTYECPTGATSSGSGINLKCYITRKDPDTYYCRIKEDILVNKKCYHFESGKFLYFKCPDNLNGKYSLDGAYCYMTSSETKDKICKIETKTVYKYKWSREKTLNGWIATGKTRTVKK